MVFGRETLAHVRALTAKHCECRCERAASRRVARGKRALKIKRSAAVSRRIAKLPPSIHYHLQVYRQTVRGSLPRAHSAGLVVPGQRHVLSSKWLLRAMRLQIRDVALANAGKGHAIGDGLSAEVYVAHDIAFGRQAIT